MTAQLLRNDRSVKLGLFLFLACACGLGIAHKRATGFQSPYQACYAAAFPICEPCYMLNGQMVACMAMVPPVHYQIGSCYPDDTKVCKVGSSTTCDDLNTCEADPQFVDICAGPFVPTCRNDYGEPW